MLKETGIELKTVFFFFCVFRQEHIWVIFWIHISVAVLGDLDADFAAGAALLHLSLPQLD